jgi:glutamyl-tRNA reductase
VIQTVDALFVVGCSQVSGAEQLPNWLELLRRFAVLERQQVAVRLNGTVSEWTILATCHRGEVYCMSDISDVARAAHCVRREILGKRASEDARGIYVKDGAEAVLHLCRVAAGLESAVVGEHEIVGQVNRAFRDIRCGPRSSGTLSRLARAARETRRRVQERTGLGRGRSSIASVGVSLAIGEGGNPTRKSVAVVGAGKVAARVCSILKARRMADVVIVNRTLARCEQLAARFGGRCAGLEDLADIIATVDVTITATGSPDPIVDAIVMNRALSIRSRLLPQPIILDLCMPPNVILPGGVSANVITLAEVTRHVHRTRDLRQLEMGAAEKIVGEVVKEFVSQESSHPARQSMAAFRRRVEVLRQQEVDKCFKSIIPGCSPSRVEIDRLTRSLINKLLHRELPRIKPDRSTGVPKIQSPPVCDASFSCRDVEAD